MTNPQLEVADIRELARVAHSHGVSGGATSVGGLIIDYGNFPEISRRIKSDILFNLGAYMTPHAAYMQTLGLETLELRYARQESSALEVALALQELPEVTAVNYLGLPDNPFHDIAEELYHGFGAVLTIELADEDACKRFINRLGLVRRATNLFDNKSLAIHPYSTIFGTIAVEEREKMDVKPTVIRLSIGLEDPADIIEDLRQAIQGE